MTLIMGMSKPEGIYVCVDYRVTDPRTGVIVDDASSKCLRVDYPPLPNGFKALLAFTGVAYLGKTPTLTWLRETLRGEAELPDQSMTHLRERLNRDFARLRQPLIVNILGVHGDRRFFGGLRNVKNGTRLSMMSEFGYVMQEINDQFLFANGSGAIAARADDKLRKINALLGVKPRSVLDHMKLLAIVNRRVAAVDPSVSPFSKVSFISAGEPFSSTSHSFTERGEEVPFEMPLLLGGIDLTDFTRGFHERVQMLKAGITPLPEQTAEEMNKDLKRRT